LLLFQRFQAYPGKYWLRLIVSFIERRAPITVMTFLLILGIIDAWAGRQSYLAGDTVSYMDMARGIAGGDLQQAANGQWSPLYPAVLAVFIRPFQSDSLLEFSMVRGVNFLIFVATIALFHMFLIRFLDHCDERPGARPESSPLFSRSQFSIAGYILLAWGCFGLTIVSRVNPDLCVAALTFAAATMLLSFKEGQVSRVRFVLFGAVLGIGYLLKAIFFPLAFLFLVAAALETRVWAVKWRLSLSLLTFLAIASPLITALSMKYGHFSYGETGKNAYRTDVLLMPLVHWQGGPPRFGTPEHPTRKILENPDVYEFASPIAATYPPWYDPTYWNAGAVLRFDSWKYGRAIVRNLKRVAVVLWFAIPVVLVLVIARRYSRIDIMSLLYFKSLWLVGIGNLAFYVVLLVEPRYLAGCLPLLVVLALAAIRFRTPNSARTVGAVLAVLLVLVVTFEIGPRLAKATALLVATRGDVRNDAWLVAEEFKRLGVKSGTPVAAIDRQDRWHWSPALVGDWALLARVTVVSEVFQLDPNDGMQFWQVAPERQAKALDALRGTGARVVVASGMPASANTTGWVRIRSSDYYYRFLE
jgi:hypothetical protein